MDADGKNPRQITHAKGYDGGPFFSPDGTRIIYRSDRLGNDLLQVYVNNTEGTAERALTKNEFVNWGPYWHPDGRHIIYATSKHGHSNYELYLMNVDTGDEVRITYHEGFDGLPVFSPDAKKLMWTSSGRTADRKSQLFIADFTLEPAPGSAPKAAAR
jgi:TolB protein